MSPLSEMRTSSPDTHCSSAQGSDPRLDCSVLPPQLAAARVVMTCGVSGSGKTALALRLADAGFVRVSTDCLIWDRHGASFPSLPEQQRRSIFMATADEVDAAVEHLLVEGKRVVVDATFCKRHRRDIMRRLCARFGVEPLLVYLSADRDTLRERLSQRRGTGPDDQRVTPAELDSYLAHFQPPLPDEHPLLL